MTTMTRLEGLDYDGSYVPYLLGSCAVCILLFIFNPRVMDRYFPVTKTVSLPDKIDFNQRLISMCHLAVVCPICIYAYFFLDELEKDPIWYNCPLVRTSCAIVSGYLLSVAVFYKEVGEMAFFYHHFASIYAYYYAMNPYLYTGQPDHPPVYNMTVLRYSPFVEVFSVKSGFARLQESYGVLPYFANFRLIAEFSTPFVNMKRFFDILGFKKSHPAFLANGVIMTIAFCFFRVMVIPFYWHKVYSVFGTEDFIKLGHLPYILVISCFVLDILNVYWFNRMCKGVVKVLRSVSHKS